MNVQPVTLAIITLIVMGTVDVIRKIAMSRGEPVVYYLIAESIILLLWLPVVGRIVHQTGPLSLRGIVFSSISGTLLALGLTCFLYALGTGQASITAPIGRMGLALTALLAVVMLGEPPTLRTLFGIGFAALAVWLLSR
jgi:transporter family protein